MATCFPSAKYIFFFISFVLAFVIANRAGPMEVFGIGLMFGINYLYTLFVGNDTLSYIQSHQRLWSGWTGLGVTSIITGLMFNFVSSILVLIGLVRLHLRNKGPVGLGVFGRKQFNEFKRLFIASIVLIGAVSANLYFTPATISTTVASLISVITEPTQHMHMFQFLCTMVAIGLFFSVIDITDFKLKGDVRLDKFRGHFISMYSVLIVLVVLIGLRAYLAYQMPQFLTMTVGRMIGFDSVFETSKWALTIVAIVFWGFSIADFDALGKPYFNRSNLSDGKHERNEDNDISGVQYEKNKDYFQRYHKYKLRPKFIFFMLFTIFLLLCNLSGSSHFMELLLLIVQVFAPIAVFGITAYNVYLANRMSKKSTHLLITKTTGKVSTTSPSTTTTTTTSARTTAPATATTFAQSHANARAPTNPLIQLLLDAVNNMIKSVSIK